MKRGDIVPAVAPGPYGSKPRPYVIVQSDNFDQHASVTALPFTSEIHNAPLFRITVDPTPSTGLTAVSQVMVDKLVTVPRGKFGTPMGRMDDDVMSRVSRALAVWLGLA